MAWHDVPVLSAAPSLSFWGVREMTDADHPRGFVSAVQRAMVAAGARDRDLVPFTEADITGVFDRRTRDVILAADLWLPGYNMVFGEDPNLRSAAGDGYTLGCAFYRALGLDVRSVVPVPGLTPNADRVALYIAEGMINPTCAAGGGGTGVSPLMLMRAILWLFAATSWGVLLRGGF